MQHKPNIKIHNLYHDHNFQETKKIIEVSASHIAAWNLKFAKKDSKWRKNSVKRCFSERSKFAQHLIKES